MILIVHIKDVAIADLSFSTEGVTVNHRKCKTDQEGYGFKKGTPFSSGLDACPVPSLKAISWKRQASGTGQYYDAPSKWTS